MKLGSRQVIVGLMGAAVLSLLSGSTMLAYGQAAPGGPAVPGEKPVMAEDAFKNVQLLRGISVKEFMETMGFFAAATNANCTTCHGDASAGSWDNYAIDTPLKQTARMMMVMVDALNRTYFGGKREVTCYSCHRNADRPKVTPKLAEQYASPLAEDPDEIARQAPGAPTPDQLLDKYIQALGGAQKLAGFASFVANGTYEGYDDSEPRPVEIRAKAPGQFFQVVHGVNGDSTWVDDGRSAWVVQPAVDAPVPLLALSGGDLDGAHLEAQLYFPARIKQLVTNLRVGFPISGTLSILPDRTGSGIDDRELTIMQGATAAGNKVKLYFDPKSGLLVRMVRYTNLPVGFITTEIDFADYRDVSGIKIPFRVTKTWVDGRSVTLLSSIQLNAPINAAQFAKPAPPVQSKAASQ
jgi:photosynthetic reaction center cytochrome c subunit